MVVSGPGVELDALRKQVRVLDAELAGHLSTPVAATYRCARGVDRRIAGLSAGSSPYWAAKPKPDHPDRHAVYPPRQWTQAAQQGSGPPSAVARERKPRCRSEATAVARFARATTARKSTDRAGGPGAPATVAARVVTPAVGCLLSVVATPGYIAREWPIGYLNRSRADGTVQARSDDATVMSWRSSACSSRAAESTDREGAAHRRADGRREPRAHPRQARGPVPGGRSRSPPCGWACSCRLRCTHHRETTIVGDDSDQSQCFPAMEP
jgi:hypothetical protein